MRAERLRFAVLLTVMLLLCCHAAMAADVYVPPKDFSSFLIQTTRDNVDVYRSPTTASLKIGLIPDRYTELTVLSETLDGDWEIWYLVQLEDGTQGYVRGRYVTSKVGIGTSLVDPDAHGDFISYQVKFQRSHDYEAYSGPSYSYLRGADGHAYMSTNDRVYVYGRERGWLLVQYDITDEHWRFGYIPLSALAEDSTVPRLNFANTTAYTTRVVELTDDPLHSRAKLYTLLAGEEVTCLARLDNWIYIEYMNVRGFVPGNCLRLGDPQGQLGLQSYLRPAVTPAPTLLPQARGRDGQPAYVTDDGEYYYIPIRLSADRDSYTAGEAVTFSVDIQGGNPPYRLYWRVQENAQIWDVRSPLTDYVLRNGDPGGSAEQTTEEHYAEFVYTPPLQGADLICTLIVVDANGMDNNSVHDSVLVHSPLDWAAEYCAMVEEQYYLFWWDDAVDFYPDSGADDSTPVSFALADLNGSGTPELIIHNGADDPSMAAAYVFTHGNGGVSLAGAVLGTAEQLYLPPAGQGICRSSGGEVRGYVLRDGFLQPADAAPAADALQPLRLYTGQELHDMGWWNAFLETAITAEAP